MKILLISNCEESVDGYSVVTQNLHNEFSKTCNVEVLYSSKKFFSLKLKSLFINKFHLILNFFDFLLISYTYIKYKPDFVLTVCEHYILPLSLFKTFFKNVKVVSIIHGTYGPYFEKKCSLSDIKKINGFVFVSNYTKSKCNLFTQVPNIVLGNGVDKTVFSSDESIKKINAISYVGNTKLRKGFSQFINVLNLIDSYLTKELKIFLIGKFDKTILKKEISNFKNITFIFKNNITNQELCDIYRICKVNVLLSLDIHNNFEGFGLVHSEAISCGTLSIGSNQSGNPCAITDGNGFIVSPYDYNNIADILLSLLNVEQPVPTGKSPADWNEIADKYLMFLNDI